MHKWQVVITYIQDPSQVEIVMSQSYVDAINMANTMIDYPSEVVQITITRINE
jgi:hypothetical protein